MFKGDGTPTYIRMGFRQAQHQRKTAYMNDTTACASTPRSKNAKLCTPYRQVPPQCKAPAHAPATNS